MHRFFKPYGKSLLLVFVLFAMVSALARMAVPAATLSVSSAPAPTVFAVSPCTDAELIRLDLDTGGSLGYVPPLVDTTALAQGRFPQTLARAGDVLPSAYDLRDRQEISPLVRNQSVWGTCWAFAAAGAAESSLYPGVQTVFSPRSLAYFAYNGAANPARPEDGTAGDTFRAWAREASETEDWWHPWYEFGGNTFMAAATFSRIGVQTETNVPYPESNRYFGSERDALGTPALKEEYRASYGDVSAYFHFNAPYRLVETNYLPTRDTEGRLNGSAIKQALLTGTSVTASYASTQYNAASLPNGKSVTVQQYNEPGKTAVNHAVQIIGWDDTIPASAFRGGSQPQNPGGWLLRNSWGKDWGTDGCFYLSYEDGSLSETCQFIASGEQPYQHNYQYDGTGWNATVGVKSNPAAPVRMANVFSASGDEAIRAVAFYTTAHDASYSIQIYTDLRDRTNPESGTPAFSKAQAGTEPYAGYHTIALQTPIRIDKGRLFSIVVEMKNPEEKIRVANADALYPVACERDGQSGGVTVEANIAPGQSFIRSGGDAWQDLANFSETDGVSLANVCLKAFTTDDPRAAAS